MKLNINIDAEAKEPEIMITTAQMTEEVNRVVDFVSRLDLSFVGTICMELSNGTVSYVSRRYVSKIKKVLGL